MKQAEQILFAEKLLKADRITARPGEARVRWRGYGGVDGVRGVFGLGSIETLRESSLIVYIGTRLVDVYFVLDHAKREEFIAPKITSYP